MDLVIEAPRLPSSGETLKGASFRYTPGGKGANQAVASALQGAPTRLIGRVGGDDFGHQLLDGLRSNGVRVSSANVDLGASTGVALITVAATGENTIVTVGGANHRVGYDELSALSKALRTARVLLVQLEIPLDVVHAAVADARQAGVVVVLDPAPAAPLAAEFLRKVDWITPNATEAEVLTGIRIENDGDAVRAAEILGEMGVSNVVITLGPQGCYYSGPSAHEFIPAPAVDVVDTVAAGDAFNGTLAAGLVQDLDPLIVLRRACIAAAIACTRRGALESLPSAREVDAQTG